MPEKPFINGVVYRDKNNVYLISLYNEKRYEITDDIYFKIENGSPLKKHHLALVYFIEKGHDNFKTFPLQIFKINFKGNAVDISGVSIDTIIENSYKAASAYITRKKLVEVLEESKITEQV